MAAESTFSSWQSSLWYDFGYLLVLPAFTFTFSLRFQGSRHLPKTGPALLVANHQSYIDPLIVGLSCSTRRLHFLARQTLFKNPYFSWLIRSVGALPVSQTGLAKEGMQAALELLKQGKPVLIFPEGERSATGEMQPLKPGITLLLKRAAVPVVPVGIAGAYDVMPRNRNSPIFSPLFLPARRKGALAASIGPPLDSRHLASLPRDVAMDEIFQAIKKQQILAEKLRRKI